jgi:uncharacterized membrane protein YqaE (UPF0057 family)
MHNNLFAPPRAVLEDASAVDGMRKPTSVWTMQLLAAVMLLFVARGFVVMVWRHSGFDVFLPRNLRVLALDLFLLFDLFATLAGSQFRWPYARWSGLLFVALICAMLSYFFLVVYPPVGVVLRGGPFGADAWAAIGLTVGVLAVAAVFCRWFGFAASSRAWFRAPVVR